VSAAQGIEIAWGNLKLRIEQGSVDICGDEPDRRFGRSAHGQF